MKKYNLMWNIDFVILVLLPKQLSLLFKYFDWDTSNSLESIIAILGTVILYLIFSATIRINMKFYKNYLGIKIINIIIVILFLTLVLSTVFLIFQISGVNV
jgi:hypothetical protein